MRVATNNKEQQNPQLLTGFFYPGIFHSQNRLKAGWIRRSNFPHVICPPPYGNLKIKFPDIALHFNGTSLRKKSDSIFSPRGISEVLRKAIEGCYPGRINISGIASQFAVTPKLA